MIDRPISTDGDSRPRPCGSGFDQVGDRAGGRAARLRRSSCDWLEAGHAAGMDYLERHAEVRAHPDRLLDGVRSVVMVSVVYGEPDPSRPWPDRRARSPATPGGRTITASSGTGSTRCSTGSAAERPEVRGRAVVDTAPLLERDFARLAGLGWIGKNTMLIDRRLGSFTFLGALLVDVELAPDAPHAADHCGTCTRCLDACPTDAFAGPYQLDARRCISYWTIEHKGPIADEFADQPRRLGLRLRRLPGRLPLEPQGAGRAGCRSLRARPDGPTPT